MKNALTYLVSIFILFVLTASMSSAASFTSNPSAQPPSDPLVHPSGCGNTIITESTSQTITPGNSVSCNDGTAHTDNGYFRAFSLDSFGIIGDYQICEVQVGVESATSGSGTQPVTINLYTSNPAFPGGALTPIGTSSIQLPDQSLTIVSIPVNGIATHGSQLVVEVFTPNGGAGTNLFFIGSNADPETAPSYLQAPDCGVPVPTTTATFGFPNMHIVLNVAGNDIVQGLAFSVSPAAAVNDTGTDHTITATVLSNGVPASGLLATFEVISGPNAGLSSGSGDGICSPNSNCETDAGGEVSWTYTGGRRPGTDSIVVSLINPNSGGVLETTVVEKTWVVPPNPIPTISQWGFIALAVILGVAGLMVMKRRKAAA